MKHGQWLIAVAAGAVIGSTVAAVMTYLDWRMNPGGIFVSAGQTDWTIVRETAFSWFWPVAAVASVAALLILLLASRLRK